MNRLLSIVLVILVILVELVVVTKTCFARADIFFYPDPPRLLYPINDKVDITGKNNLEFKWWNDQINTDHFEFRLYKGANMYEDGLLIKQSLPLSAGKFPVSADIFNDGQTYTWSLIRVDLSGKKSDRNFNTFVVTKRAGN